MAILKRFLVRNDEIWMVVGYKQYKLRGETILETIEEGKAYLLQVRPRPDIKNALEERVAEKLKEISTYENEEKETLKKWLEALQAYGVPIEEDEDEDED